MSVLTHNFLFCIFMSFYLYLHDITPINYQNKKKNPLQHHDIIKKTLITYGCTSIKQTYLIGDERQGVFLLSRVLLFDSRKQRKTFKNIYMYIIICEVINNPHPGVYKTESSIYIIIIFEYTKCIIYILLFS